MSEPKSLNSSWNRQAQPTSNATVWREPGEETLGLYPGLVVWDDRVSGSITLGQSRLPLWCFAYVDWPEWDAYGTDSDGAAGPHYGVTKEHLRGFVYNLFEMRGEFARLLLILADGERRDTGRMFGPAWWEKKGQRKRVLDQLHRCIAALNGGASNGE